MAFTEQGVDHLVLKVSGRVTLFGFLNEKFLLLDLSWEIIRVDSDFLVDRVSNQVLCFVL